MCCKMNHRMIWSLLVCSWVMRQSWREQQENQPAIDPRRVTLWENNLTFHQVVTLAICQSDTFRLWDLIKGLGLLVIHLQLNTFGFYSNPFSNWYELFQTNKRGCIYKAGSASHLSNNNNSRSNTGFYMTDILWQPCILQYFITLDRLLKFERFIQNTTEMKDKSAL